MIDPACGTAGFLISAYRHILAQNKDEDSKSTLTADDRKRLTENFAGYDISPDMVRLSRVNMYLHHFTKPKISEYDTLTSEEKWDDCYDVILANPPFMTPKGGIVPHSRYRVKAKRSEVLFVDYIAEHLNPTGRAAIIVPEGIVFQSANAYKELRKYLVDDGLLYAVISLPAGVFNPYSGVKTSILLIDKSFARLKDEILFVKLNNDGFDLGAQRREIEGSEIPEIIRIVQKYHADFEPQTADDDILHHPLVTITSKKKIASQDYILVGERYRESNNIISKWPLVSIGEVCELRVGGTPSKQQEEYWSNGTIKWISSKYISDDGKITNYQLITEQALRDSSTKIAPKDSVILITRVSVGKFAYTTTEYAINQDLTCLIPGRGLNPKFLYYMARSLALQIAQNAQGIGVKGVTQKYVSEMKIPFPPLMVQEEIVAELDSHQKSLTVLGKL